MGRNKSIFRRGQQCSDAKPGFTIIEVSLVLAVSGLLMVGLIAGLSSSVARQRYNDSVQDFTEFLRSVYSEVSNTEHTNLDGAYGGNRGSAIYGKVISIRNNTADVYTLVGNADAASVSESDPCFNNAAADTSAEITRLFNCASLRLDKSTAERTYTPPWQARILNRDTTFNPDNLFGGAIFILHSPSSGTVHTYFHNTTIAAADTSSNTFKDKYNDGSVPTTGTINFCVYSDDVYAAGRRLRNVRILRDGSNSSAVQLVDVDYDHPDTDSDKEGNVCPSID